MTAEVCGSALSISPYRAGVVGYTQGRTCTEITCISSIDRPMDWDELRFESGVVLRTAHLSFLRSWT